MRGVGLIIHVVSNSRYPRSPETHLDSPPGRVGPGCPRRRRGRCVRGTGSGAGRRSGWRAPPPTAARCSSSGCCCLKMENGKSEKRVSMRLYTGNKLNNIGATKLIVHTPIRAHTASVSQSWVHQISKSQ